MEYFHHHHRTNRKLAAGFTLIELLVVLAIITVITGMTITSQGSFNKSLILANTAYDIALSFRSAETYGIGSLVAGTVSNAGYGLHFNRATPGSFTLFADTNSPADGCHPLPPASRGGANAPDAKPGNCFYDVSIVNASGVPIERVTDYTLGNGITISDFCARGSGGWSCANSNGNSLLSLNVVFARPNPDPFISVNGAYSGLFTAACIRVTSPQGGFRYVSVVASGAITADASPSTSQCPSFP